MEDSKSQDESQSGASGGASTDNNAAVDQGSGDVLNLNLHNTIGNCFFVDVARQRPEKIPIDTNCQEMIYEDKHSKTALYKSQMWPQTHRCQNVLLKVLTDAKPQYMKAFENEIKFLQQLDHEYIVRYIGSKVDADNATYVLVKEFVSSITVLDFLHKDPNTRLSNSEFYSMSIQATKALQHIHDKGMVHGDIRATRFFVAHDNTLVLTEFGDAKYVKGASSISTDSGYSMDSKIRCSAPEALEQEEISKKSDIWSLLILIWVLLTKQTPYQDIKGRKIKNKIIDALKDGKRPDIPATCSSVLRDLFVRGWAGKPENRPDVNTVLTILESMQRNGSGAP